MSNFKINHVSLVQLIDLVKEGHSFKCTPSLKEFILLQGIVFHSGGRLSAEGQQDVEKPVTQRVTSDLTSQYIYYDGKHKILHPVYTRQGYYGTLVPELGLRLFNGLPPITTIEQRIGRLLPNLEEMEARYKPPTWQPGGVEQMTGRRLRPLPNVAVQFLGDTCRATLSKETVTEATRDYQPTVKGNPVLVWLKEKATWELWHRWSDNIDERTMSCYKEPDYDPSFDDCRTFSNVADIEGNILYMAYWPTGEKNDK